MLPSLCNRLRPLQKTITNPNISTKHSHTYDSKNIVEEGVAEKLWKSDNQGFGCELCLLVTSESIPAKSWPPKRELHKKDTDTHAKPHEEQPTKPLFTLHKEL